jgi:hypothetical protein
MPPGAPKSIATLESSPTGDTARAAGLLVDRLGEKANPAYGLPPVCFTALTAAASVNGDGPVLTFVTRTGKSLQVLLQLPADKTRAFCSD